MGNDLRPLAWAVLGMLVFAALTFLITASR